MQKVLLKSFYLVGHCWASIGISGQGQGLVDGVDNGTQLSLILKNTWRKSGEVIIQYFSSHFMHKIKGLSKKTTCLQGPEASKPQSHKAESNFGFVYDCLRSRPQAKINFS